MDDLDSISRNIVQTSLDARPEENILIHGWEHTVDIVSKIAWQCRKRGAAVLLAIQPEDFWLRSVLNSPLRVLEKPAESLIAALEESQAYVFTLGPRHPIPWNKIPLGRRKEVSVWLDRRFDQSRFAKEWTRVAAKHRIRMLGVEATLATPERAKALGLDFQRWRKVMMAGCAANWKAVSRRALKLKRLLDGKEEVHLTTPAGTKLEFRLDRRPVSYGDGLTSEENARKGIVTFLPSGGIEASIDEQSAQGTIVYNLPIRTAGEIVTSLRLEVKDGCVKDFSADKGKNAFEEYLNSGPGAGRLSFFGLGLNPNLRFGFTQDDKVLGGVELGLGDNLEKGGRNPAKGREWWGVVSAATLRVGDTRMMQRGRILV